MGVSLCTSLTVLVLWGVLLMLEARGYGLRFYEVNWTDFRFDSHSGAGEQGAHLARVRAGQHQAFGLLAD